MRVAGSGNAGVLRRLSAAVACLLLLVVLAPSSLAATVPGPTDPLVNPGQRIRDASSAVPVVGFAMTATGPGEALDFVTVSFAGAGFDPGDDNDLRALNVLAGLSGVALYRDDGATEDILDA